MEPATGKWTLGGQSLSVDIAEAHYMKSVVDLGWDWWNDFHTGTLTSGVNMTTACHTHTHCGGAMQD
jgi:hypothetical protein